MGERMTNYTELCQRLVSGTKVYNDAKGTSYTRMRNPDGKEAAEAIQALMLENVNLRDNLGISIDKLFNVNFEKIKRQDV
jgi:hypothetical protein